MFHIYGLFMFLGGLPHFGATIIVIRKFDFEKVLKAIEHYKINRAHVVPPVILALAKSPVVSKYDLSSLKVIISAAAPLSESLTLECQNRLKISIKQAYGMTGNFQRYINFFFQN